MKARGMGGFRSVSLPEDTPYKADDSYWVREIERLKKGHAQEMEEKCKKSYGNGLKEGREQANFLNELNELGLKSYAINYVINEVGLPEDLRVAVAEYFVQHEDVSEQIKQKLSPNYRDASGKGSITDIIIQAIGEKNAMVLAGQEPLPWYQRALTWWRRNMGIDWISKPPEE